MIAAGSHRRPGYLYLSLKTLFVFYVRWMDRSRGPVYRSRGMDIFVIQEGFRGFDGVSGRPIRRPISLRCLHGRLERGKEGLKGST